MRFYEFGHEDKPTILLIPGTCCHWTLFKDVVPHLRRSFRPVVVSFDGFDEHQDTVYPTMEREAEGIERYVRERLGGRVACVYGCSLGGSYVAYLVQRRRIRIDHGILGSSDMDEAGPLVAAAEARVFTLVMEGLLRDFRRGRVPAPLAWAVARRRREDPEAGRQLARFVDEFAHMPIVATLRPDSVYSQFYWDLVTPIERGIDVPGTTVHVFYATGMGPRYEARYRAHFAHPDIRRQDMGHEAFLFCHPREWVREVEVCCGLG